MFFRPFDKATYLADETRWKVKNTLFLFFMFPFTTFYFILSLPISPMLALPYKCVQRYQPPCVKKEKEIGLISSSCDPIAIGLTPLSLFPAWPRIRFLTLPRVPCSCAAPAQPRALPCPALLATPLLAS
jgi:hypothetical protein